MMFRLYNPALFQGNLKMRGYFEGWYFKHVTSDLSGVWSFIPGISLNNSDPHAFIQIINGVTGDTYYKAFAVSDFRMKNNSFDLSIGNSRFTEKNILLDIETENLRIEGEINYHNSVKYPSTLFSPGIMGWYSFVPFMECKHGIISVNHTLTGRLKVNNTDISFNNGKGYIEKDWGTSFPEAWIWIQSNNFSNPLTSFTFSVAKIPWLGRFFPGFIAFLYYNEEFILFSTYNKSVLSEVIHDEEGVSLTMKNRKYTLRAVSRKNTFGELKAPSSGVMSRRIKESVDSEVTLSLFDLNGLLIYNDTGKRAGMEVIEKIFEYI
jgi:tocopherol cyclase